MQRTPGGRSQLAQPVQAPGGPAEPEVEREEVGAQLRDIDRIEGGIGYDDPVSLLFEQVAEQGLDEAIILDE